VKDFLGKIGKKIPGLNYLINGPEINQTIQCAFMPCYGSRHLSDELRQSAHEIEPMVKVAALAVSAAKTIDLQSMSRQNLETVFNHIGATVPRFNQIYGSTSQIIDNIRYQTGPTLKP
jgi:hypothetical protein